MPCGRYSVPPPMPSLLSWDVNESPVGSLQLNENPDALLCCPKGDLESENVHVCVCGHPSLSLGLPFSKLYGSWSPCPGLCLGRTHYPTTPRADGKSPGDKSRRGIGGGVGFLRGRIKGQGTLQLKGTLHPLPVTEAGGQLYIQSPRKQGPLRFHSALHSHLTRSPHMPTYTVARTAILKPHSCRRVPLRQAPRPSLGPPIRTVSPIDLFPHSPPL